MNRNDYNDQYLGGTLHLLLTWVRHQSAILRLINPPIIIIKYFMPGIPDNLIFQIVINKHCGIFVTLNPAGGSYGGRNKLPDNLKQLFRPIVMTQPNNEEIAKSLLLSEGFQNANTIATKLVEVFHLARYISQ